MFDFKKSLWEQKRNEFCYAGAWSGLLNIGNGIMRQCYGHGFTQNIFDDLSKPIIWCAVGHNCSMPHCYNSHSLLGLGDIPSISGNYAQERDRIDERDGSHWLTEDMREFLRHRLEDYNLVYDKGEENKADRLFKKQRIESLAKSVLKVIIRK